jgi:hypothetical protein
MLQIFDKRRPNEFAHWRDEVLYRYLHLSPEAPETMYERTGTCFEKRGSTVDCMHAEDMRLDGLKVN